MSQHPPPGWVPPGGPGPSEAPAVPSSPPPHPGYGVPPGYGPPWGAPVHKPGVVALRPLTLGDLFDGAFRTIRRNPQAMVGLAAAVITAFLVLPALVTLALAAAGDLSFDLAGETSDGGLSTTLGSGAVTVMSNLGSVFGFLATVVLNGMLVHVVAEAVLGRRTGIGAAWAATRGRLLRLLGLTLLNLLVVVLLLAVPAALGVLVGVGAGVGPGLAVGVPLFLAAVVLLVLVEIRFFQLAAPALVLERLGVLASLRRAGALSRHQFWRLLGIAVLTTLVVGVVGQVIAIPLALLGVAGGAVLPGTGGAVALVFSSYLSQIVVGAVTTPFTSAVVALLYVDQRIRKEGLDVQLIAASQQRPPGLS
jgi:hypothetical protein